MKEIFSKKISLLAGNGTFSYTSAKRSIWPQRGVWAIMYTTTKGSDLVRHHLIPAAGTPHHIDMRRVACLVLGGGQGTRLLPLTQSRSKPAVPFGGRYRLIDVPLSNAKHSGCGKIFVYTQFLSTSLHRHICNTYVSHSLGTPSVEIFSAEQKPSTDQWFLGTADAIRKSLEYLEETPADYFLILSGDQLYQMNFRPMVAFAEKTDADLVVASLPVDASHANRMGVLKVDIRSSITDFYEKPQNDSILDNFRCPTSLLEELGHTQTDQPFYLASMGIYLFKRQALFDLLRKDPREDFGKHLIPTKVAQGKASAFLFDGYWEDIGTIEAYYNANIALTRPEPFYNFYDEHFPLFAAPHNLPAPKIFDTRLMHSVVCEGSIIEAREIRNSILGPRTVVKHGTTIHDSYLIGNDHYTPPVRRSTTSDRLQIGRNCVIQRAIIDSDVCIGDNVQLINKNKLVDYDDGRVYVRDGIIVVTRGTHLPDGYIL